MYIQKKTWLTLTTGGFLGYLIFGLFDSLKGSTISSLLEDMNYNHSVGGTIVMGQYAGYFAATFLVGNLIHYYGQKATLIFAAICMLLGVIGYSFSSAVILLLLYIFLIGMGLGGFELVGCNIITEHYSDKKGRYLNILTAIAGLGSIISPILVGYLLNRNMSWRMVYRYGLLFLIPSTLYFMLITDSVFANSRPSKKHMTDTKPLCNDNIHHKSNLFTIFLSNFFYMAMEMGVATWIVNYYKDERFMTISESTKFLSFFYIGMTLGRLAGSLFVDRYGQCKSVLVASGCTCLSIIIGIFGPTQLSFCVALSGLFCSIIFPTGTAILSGLPHGDSARTQGLYFAFGGLGGMFGPWIMGTVIDYWGIKQGMVLAALFCIIIFLTIIRFTPYSAKHQ